MGRYNMTRDRSLQYRVELVVVNKKCSLWKN